MIIQYLAAGGILSGLAAMLVWLQAVNRREMDRRSRLPLEEQKRLANEEEAWRQGYSF